MITAAQAKELYDQSGAEVNDFLTHKVEKYIRDAAMAGKRSVFVLVDSEETWKTITPSPFNRQVIDKLKELGYTAKFGRDGESYVPRGLADDNGNGPKHTNVGYTIGW